MKVCIPTPTFETSARWPSRSGIRRQGSGIRTCVWVSSSAKGGATKWFDTGNSVWEYLVARVTWTPDAKKLFVTRTNRVQSKLELLAYDVESRKSVQVLEESDLYWVNLLDEPHFIKGGSQFLWLSERDGFAHLYLYSADGKLQQRLTEGPWMVTSLDAVDDSAAYFTSTEVSPLERHVYSVGLNGQGRRNSARARALTVSTWDRMLSISCTRIRR